SMNPYRTGKLVLFQVVYDRDWHGFDLIFFSMLGIMGGLYGALFIRMNLKVAVFLTFGLKVPAGVWLPSIAIGACFGRAVGLIVHAWHKYDPGFWLFASCEPDSECITPGMYAMVGAAATFGGVTRMTVSLVVIMFELTGALTYVLPIMIAVMISKWVGDAFDKEGIYDGWIRINEYPFLDSKEDYVYNTLASQYMTRIEDLM
ncbi:20388_t:CDS:2, partial [Racocetra persica]